MKWLHAATQSSNFISISELNWNGLISLAFVLFVFNSFQSAINSISTHWIDWAVELNESLRSYCVNIVNSIKSNQLIKFHLIEFDWLISFTLCLRTFIHSFSLHSLKWNWMRETKSWMNSSSSHLNQLNFTQLTLQFI